MLYLSSFKKTGLDRKESFISKERRFFENGLHCVLTHRQFSLCSEAISLHALIINGGGPFSDCFGTQARLPWMDGWMDEGKVGRARGGEIEISDDLFIDLGYRFHSGISISKFVVKF